MRGVVLSSKSDSPPIPEPTLKLYRNYPSVAYFEGRTDEVPEPIEVPLSDLVLDTEEPCVIRVRGGSDFARRNQQDMWEAHQCLSLEVRDAVVNYIDIGPPRWHGATFLCASEEVYPLEEATWYRINHDDADGKVIRPMEYTETYLSFSEVDKFGPGSGGYFFDGTFSDLLEVLEAEGFRMADA